MTYFLPSGTTIYLSDNFIGELNLIPNATLESQTYYISYDVRYEGITIFPKGTPVTGIWISSNDPVPQMQFQTQTIRINNIDHPINAYSNIYYSIKMANNIEVDNNEYFYTFGEYRTPSGITKRIASINCEKIVLNDRNLNTEYIVASNKEIPVILQYDFCI